MSISEYIYTVLLRPAPLRWITNKFLRAILPKIVQVGDARISINPNDPVVSGALTLRVYEREEIAFFRKHYKSGMTFVDVGANVGLYTALALATGKSRILCIEPHAESRRFLNETIRLNLHGEESAGLVTVAAVAAGAMPGRLTLYSNSENKGDNRIYSDGLLDTSTTVEVSTIDSLCASNGISTIDFMKMDIQGAEFKALQGASNVLSRSPECILMTEFWAYGISRAGDDPKDYLELIRNLGFTILELQKRTLNPVRDSNLLSDTSGREYRNIIALKGQDHSLFIQ